MVAVDINFKKILRVLVYLPVAITIINSVLNSCREYILPHLYIFDPTKIQALVHETLDENPGANNTVLFNSFSAKLSEEYGSYVNPIDYNNFHFSNAGGAMGTFFIFHASFSEYLIVFGTAIGTEGHTGHHLADDYFIILSGEQTAAYSHQNEASVYKPGDMHHLPYGNGKQYSMPAGSFAVELAQGYIPTMLFFGFADSIFSCLDPFNLWYQIKFTSISMFNNLVQGKI